MADDETTALQKEIEYLTNLIKGAKNCKSEPIKSSSHWSAPNSKSKVQQHIHKVHSNSPTKSFRNITSGQQSKVVVAKTIVTPKCKVTLPIHKDVKSPRTVTKKRTRSLPKDLSSSPAKVLRKSDANDVHLATKTLGCNRVVKLPAKLGKFVQPKPKVSGSTQDSQRLASKPKTQNARTVHSPSHPAFKTDKLVDSSAKLSEISPLHGSQILTGEQTANNAKTVNRSNHTSIKAFANKISATNPNIIEISLQQSSPEIWASNYKLAAQNIRMVHHDNHAATKISSRSVHVRHTQEPLVRSVSDRCLEEKNKVVKSEQSSSSNQDSGCKDPNQGPVLVPYVDTLSNFSKLMSEASALNIMGSPTINQAREKIISEIERLNKAVAQMNNFRQKAQKRQEAQEMGVDQIRETQKDDVSVVKGAVRAVLPHGSSALRYSSPSPPTPTGLLQKDKYRLVKGSKVNNATQHSTTVTSSVPLKCKKISNMPSPLCKAQTYPADGGSQKVHQGLQEHGPYKLVRAMTDSQQPVRLQCSTSMAANSPAGRFKLANDRSGRTPLSHQNRYKLISHRSLSSPATENGTRCSLHIPAWSPRKRLYLSQRRLQNGPVILPSPPKSLMMESPPFASTPRPAMCTHTNTSQIASSRAGQSADMKVLLRELAFIDTAFKTAKLQSSQKLLKRALITKQNMMRRRSVEKRMAALPTRTHRQSHAKWSGHISRRSRLRSRPPSSTKAAQRSWSSRFSLKKSTAESEWTLNRLLGRSVDNVSSNKYKFIKRRAPQPLSSFTHHRLRYRRSLLFDREFSRSPHHDLQYGVRARPSKNSLQVDRRPKSLVHGRSRFSGKTAVSPPSGRLVTIGGLVYVTSHRKLTRTSSRRNSTTPKGDAKCETRTVVVEGHQFKVTPKTLFRVKQDADGVQRVSLGGVKYIQTRPGMLVRAARTASRATASRFIYRSLATAVGAAARQRKARKAKAYCIFYNRFGKCNRGDACPYIHDPDMVAICTRFLRGTCRAAACAFSHQVAPHKMPVCTQFLRGVCSRDECLYRHVKVNRDAATCQDFVNGYCPLANKCKKKHSRVCPHHDGAGRCPRGAACKLYHPRRAERRGERCKERRAAGDTTQPVSQPPRVPALAGTRTPGSTSEPAADADLLLPLAQRHLPAFIPIFKTPVGIPATPSPNVSASGEEPLQIRPNLSFDGN